MSYAFDYEEMLEDVAVTDLYEPCTGNFHPTSRLGSQEPAAALPAGPRQSRGLLDEAGWTDSDGDGIRDKEIDGKRVPFEFT